MATETFPLPKGQNGLNVLNGVHSHWMGVASNYVKNAGMLGIATIAYQPIPQMISEATQKYGGNVMDMGNGNRIVLEYDVMYVFDDDAAEANADKATRDIYEGTKRVVDGFVQTKVVSDYAGNLLHS
jgi:hypothetical protein